MPKTIKAIGKTSNNQHANTPNNQYDKLTFQQDQVVDTNCINLDCLTQHYIHLASSEIRNVIMQGIYRRMIQQTILYYKTVKDVRCLKMMWEEPFNYCIGQKWSLSNIFFCIVLEEVLYSVDQDRFIWVLGFTARMMRGTNFCATSTVLLIQSVSYRPVII